MNIEDINKYCVGTFVDYLGIVITSWEDEVMIGELEIKDHHKMPKGFVHGGVYISLAETLAGAASSMIIENENKAAFGTVVDSQHVASVREGKIIATAILFWKGDYKHIWDVKICDADGKLISTSRVTNTIKELK